MLDLLRGPRLRAALLLLTLLVAAAAVGGCGSAAEDSPDASATILLDFQPNAVHTGIYTAVARGYDEALGVHLHIRAPSASTDSVKLLAAGRTDFAILDIHDLALARERGRDLVGVMAIVEQPLAALLAQPDIKTPRDLAGRRVGVTGLPSDVAVLRSIVSGAGGDPDAVRPITIGFDAVQSMLTRRVAAATAFWNAEGVELQARRPGIREFRVDDYGAPSYPELVLCVKRSTLQDSPSLVRATVSALARGYDAVLDDPEDAVSTLLAATSGLDRASVQRELDAVQPAFMGTEPAFGVLDMSVLRKWALWEARFGITKKPPDVNLAFDGQYVPKTDQG